MDSSGLPYSEMARALFGLIVFIALAWAMSERKKAFPIRAVLTGLGLQIALAILLTRVPAVTAFFGGIAHGVDAVQSSATTGAQFVFGYLSGGASPFAATGVASTFIFAFQALPAVLLVSALSALLWHWGILRVIVRGTAWAFSKALGVSGPVGVSTSACVFLGMVEAPLLVRPMIPKLSRGELFIIMVDGMSVIAGSIMILLGTMLAPRMPDAFSHLLIASLISTPMAITLARIVIPDETTKADGPIPLENPYRSSLDAMTHGTFGAVKMAVNIGALLIVFIGTISLINMGLAQIPHQGAPITLSLILGWIFSPIAWLMGVPLSDLKAVGGLLGTKISLNEVVAYGELLALPEGALSPKSFLILTYALCSFGNIGSVAILIGTLTAIAPERSSEIVDLGFKALACAFLTTCMTGALIGLLTSFM
jgi:concentrative nucleoside transporter, CNT family